MKKINLIILSVLLVSLLSFSVLAQEGDFIDPDIPESWYEAPQTASEIGVSEFNQSPMLQERVADGELPPVEERLPEDPPVIEPYGEIGEYGGTANVWGTTLDYGGDVRYLDNIPTAGQPSPDGNKMLPYYMKGWEFSDDYKEITINLRKGVKWSDGSPLTTDDVMYWWDNVAHNEILSTVPPEEWANPLLEIVQNDKYSYTVKFQNSAPRYDEYNFQYQIIPGVGALQFPPSSYMKQFHPDFAGEDEVQEMAENVELETWDDYYWRVQEDSVVHPEFENQRPVLRPYVAVERTETNLILERNPYYPFVDTEGNQLPYLDRIRVNLANNEEMAASKAATGEATIAGRYTVTRDIPLYKKNEQNEPFSTYIYYRGYGSEAAIQPNFTHEDPALREIFQNVNFRRALSLGIDREEINNKIYYGRATAMQATVPPINKEFKEEYAQSYVDYKPEEAEKLLDEMGMVDNNGDGFRERPDGEKFNPTLLYSKIGPVEPTPLLEMVRGDFEEIGIDINLKMVSRELINQRRPANDFDMSVWTVDGIVGCTFGNMWHMTKAFAPADGDIYGPFPGWVNWYKSGGEEGMEPPAHMKELNEALRTLNYNTDENTRQQAAQKLLDEQAENLWVIGTVGLGPQPIIVGEDLKNVPRKGIWDWSFRYMKNMNPVQFYMEQ